MVKTRFQKIGDAGSLMIEALAMLGLISMVTPIIYKKAAERNSEIQDVNSSAQLRNIVRAADDYTRENYNKIASGDTIPKTCPGGSDINFSNMAAAGEQMKSIDIANLCAYLPYGFLDNSGNITDDRIFGQNYKMIIKKTDGGTDQKKALTNFVIATPKQGKDFAKIRASRIASMIGSNGGFIDDDGSAKGVQGMWYIDNPASSLGITIGDDVSGNKDVSKGSIIASSVHPISTGGGADHLLHRNYTTNRPELNTMNTAILMNNNNLEDINQAVIKAQGIISDRSKALLLDEGAGAYITGVFAAADGKFAIDDKGAIDALDGKFIVDDTNIKYTDGTNEMFSVTNTGDMNLKKNAIIGGDANVGGNLTVSKIATIGDGTKTTDQLVVKGSAHIQGNLKVDDRFSAKDIDAGTLRAGTATPHSTTDSAYTMKVDSTALMVKDASAKDRFRVDRSGNTTITDGNMFVKKGTNNIFNVDQTTSYTTVNGLKAGTSTTNPALQVYNATAGGNIANDVIMSMNSGSNKIVAYDNNNKTALSLTSGVSTLQKVNASNNAIYSNYEAREGYARTKSANAASESFLDVRPDSVTMDVDKSTASAVNVGIYRPSVKGTRSEMWLQDNTDLKVITKTNDNIFHVDNATNTGAYVKNNTNKGSVYVRRGAIEVASGAHGYNTVNPYKTTGDTEMGHIKADTFISHKALEAWKMVPNASNFSQGTTKYDAFMVNPAYTSVMHDIKITTRGGARLSDILPDFINKGIYVVDNTYAENKSLNVNGDIAYTTDAGNGPASPWVGTVPAPQCPPGYQKVITVVPSTFAMAQAGYPITKGRGSRYGGADFEIPTDAHVQIVPGLNTSSVVPEPLYFQKSTWLKTKIYPAGSEGGSTFKGWNVLLGFIYPKSIYSGSGYATQHDSTVLEDATLGVYWNLYPVFSKELEAFANVYCYFARGRWANDYVDYGYDQLTPGKFRPVQTKGDSDYNSRLNDPNLKYNDVW